MIRSAPLELPAEFVRVLEGRAERLRSHRAAELTDGDQLLTAELNVGDEVFAFRLEALRSVVPLSRVTPVPLSRPEVIGLVRFQGQLATALSLPALLGGRAWSTDPSVLLIAEARPGLLVGLDCERVPRPSTLPRSLVEAAAGVRGAAPFVELFAAGDRPINLVDFEGLLARLPGGPHGG